MSECQYTGFIVLEVTIGGNWVNDTRDFFVLFFTSICESIIISRF